MTKKKSRSVGIVMIMIAIVFICYALGHPESAFPWSNTVTYVLYGAYFLITIVALIAPFQMD